MREDEGGIGNRRQSFDQQLSKGRNQLSPPVVTTEHLRVDGGLYVGVAELALLVIMGCAEWARRFRPNGSEKHL